MPSLRPRGRITTKHSVPKATLTASAALTHHYSHTPGAALTKASCLDSCPPHDGYRMELWRGSQGVVSDSAVHGDYAKWTMEELRHALLGSDRDTRMQAAFQLSDRGRDGDAPAVILLIDALDVPAPVTPQGTADWEYVVDYLIRVGPSAVQPLIAVLVDRSRPELMREGAARALGNLGDARAVEPLLDILMDENDYPGVRAMIAFYVGRLRDPRVVEPLLALAADPGVSQTLRRNALHGLGHVSDPRLFHALVPLLADGEVARFAATVLADSHDPRALAELLPEIATDDPTMRLHIAAIVGKLGERAVEPLLESLKSPDWRVREGAATALGFAVSKAAEAPLREMLVHDRSPEARRAAASSLGFGDDPAVCYALVAALDDPDVLVRQAAMFSIYHFAMTSRAPVNILPQVELVAANDTGTIEGHSVVREAGERAARELRRCMRERGA